MRVEELRGHAAPRRRVVDEHMFSVHHGGQLPATMRLQVFTAPGARPIVIATQAYNEGPSLVNRADTYVSEAWRRFCPDERQPPLWIQRLIFDGDSSEDVAFELVTFEEATQHRVAGPSWWPIFPEELDSLIREPVDLGRGDGYVPRPPEPVQEPRYRVLHAARLPRPRTVRAPGCMPAAGIPWGRRMARQLFPRPVAQDCCWYHGGDWTLVASTALHLLGQARREGGDDDTIDDRLRGLVRRTDLPAWEREALTTLVIDPIWMQFGGRVFGNGNHRCQAMLEQGVRWIPVVEYVAPPGRAEAEAALDAWAAEHAPKHVGDQPH